MTRTVPYRVKTTTANTEYRELTKQDRRWVLSQCQSIVDFDNACQKSIFPDLKDDSRRLNAPNPNMPRKSASHGGGRNSVRSMCEGTIDNFNSGQYDLSSKTMAGIEESFRVVNSIEPDFEDVVFEETTVLPTPTALNPHKSKESIGNSTFPDLFDIKKG